MKGIYLVNKNIRISIYNFFKVKSDRVYLIMYYCSFCLFVCLLVY